MTTKEKTRQVMSVAEAVLDEVKAIREEQSSHNQQHEDNDMNIKSLKEDSASLNQHPLFLDRTN